MATLEYVFGLESNFVITELGLDLNLRVEDLDSDLKCCGHELDLDDGNSIVSS